MTPLDERMILQHKISDSLTLTTDGPVAMSLGGIQNVHVLHLKASAPITARLTSASGSQQLVPVDPILIQHAFSVPFTAIDLIRSPGVLTDVNFFIGEHP